MLSLSVCWRTLYCCLLPEVLVLKAFWELLRPARLIGGAVKCWQVTPNPYLLVTENMEWLKCRSFKRWHLEAICVADGHCFFWIIALPAPPLLQTTLWCCIFPNLTKAERSKHSESDCWPPVTTTTVRQVPRLFPHQKLSLPPPPRVDWHSIVLRVFMMLDGGLEVSSSSHQGGWMDYALGINSEWTILFVPRLQFIPFWFSCLFWETVLFVNIQLIQTDRKSVV